jgi:hypothetical protein
MSPLLSIFDILAYFRELANLGCAHSNRFHKLQNCSKRIARFNVNDGAAGRRRYEGGSSPLARIVMALATHRCVPQSPAILGN